MILIRPCCNYTNYLRISKVFKCPSAFSLYCWNNKNVRNIYSEVNDKVLSRYLQRDKLNHDHHLIYRAPLLNYVKYAYWTAFTTLTVSPPLFGTTVYFNGLGTYPVILGKCTLANSEFELFCFCIALIVIWIQITHVVFKYPFRIYRNSLTGKYVVIYQDLLPWAIKKSEFQAGEAVKINPKLSLFSHCTYQLGRRQAILLEDYFHKPADFNGMFTEEKNLEKTN